MGDQEARGGPTKSGPSEAGCSAGGSLVGVQQQRSPADGLTRRCLGELTWDRGSRAAVPRIGAKQGKPFEAHRRQSREKTSHEEQERETKASEASLVFFFCSFPKRFLKDFLGAPFWYFFYLDFPPHCGGLPSRGAGANWRGRGLFLVFCKCLRKTSSLSIQTAA